MEPVSDTSSGGQLRLIIHRSAHEIGGNCVELAWGGYRILLDAGSQLEPSDGSLSANRIPATLDCSRPIDAVIISHPHQDHYGLLQELPRSWPVWVGASAEVLMRMTAALRGGSIQQSIHTYRSFTSFAVGPFSITPYLTDHSAFDAHMLLVEVGGKRILYSGDFRRVGRKSSLVDRMLETPPGDIDVLLLEGATLGRSERFPTETELEEEFLALFRGSSGRVFISWSAQNIDRTVTIYRACKRSGRTLCLDIYTLDVLERLSIMYDSLPRLGWSQIEGVVTAGIKRLYESHERLNAPEFVTRCARSGHAIGAAQLETRRSDRAIMLRPTLLRDFESKGVTIKKDDVWVFSMWSGYLESAEYREVRKRFDSVGAAFAQIHTSGHASRDDLEKFAARIAPRCLVPIHSFNWDEHLHRFANVQRLSDGEPFTIGLHK